MSVKDSRNTLKYKRFPHLIPAILPHTGFVEVRNYTTQRYGKCGFTGPMIIPFYFALDAVALA